MGSENKIFLWADFFLQKFSANGFLTLIKKKKKGWSVLQIWYSRRPGLFSHENRRNENFFRCYCHLYFLTLNAVSPFDWELLINLFHKINQLIEKKNFYQNENFSNIYTFEHISFLSKKIVKPLECSRSFTQQWNKIIFSHFIQKFFPA